MNYLKRQRVAPSSPGLQGDYYFSLQPNSYQRFLQGYTRLILLVVLPLLATYCVLLAAGWPSALFCGSIMGIVLVVGSLLFYYDRRRAKTQHATCTLAIHENRITVSGEQCPDQTVAREELTVTMLGWGEDLTNLYPAIRLTGKDLEMTIGINKGAYPFSDVRQTVQATDYLMSSPGAWQELLKALDVPEAQQIPAFAQSEG